MQDMQAQGYNQSEISNKLGVSLSSIYNDLKAMEDEVIQRMIICYAMQTVIEHDLVMRGISLVIRDLWQELRATDDRTKRIAIYEQLGIQHARKQSFISAAAQAREIILRR